jgi:(2Fe-2S) ferredoxin
MQPGHGPCADLRTTAPYNLRILSATLMSYYQRHVFFCLNVREDAAACCGCHNAAEMQQYAKSRIKQMGLNGEGKIRVNKSGCLDRCDEGPCVVVYPEGVWYTYVDKHDIDEIIDSHLVKGEVVERLRI